MFEVLNVVIDLVGLELYVLFGLDELLLDWQILSLEHLDLE